jgi:hypothetical protein
VSEFVLVKMFDNRLEADIAKSYLESEGIDVFIRADDAGGMLPTLSSLNGVALFVPEQDFAKARAILTEEE